MNWKQYFEIKNRQKKVFFVVFFTLLFFGLLNFKDLIILGAEHYCDKHNYSCYDANNSKIQINYTFRETVFLECRCGVDRHIWAERYKHTPYLLIPATSIAFLSSVGVYFFLKKKTEEIKTEPKEEPKEPSSKK